MTPPPPNRPRAGRGFTRARNANGNLSETAWQARVTALAGYYGWLSYHTHDSRRSDAGFPDLVMVRAAELLIVELKTDTPSRRVTVAEAARRPAWLAHRDITAQQAAWLDAFRTLGEEVDRARKGSLEHYQDVDARLAVEAHVWRPRDWERVQARLSRHRVRQDAVGPSYEDPAGD